MKLKRSLVLLLSANLVFSSIQLPVFANETNEPETQTSVSVNSDLDEVECIDDIDWEDETNTELYIEATETLASVIVNDANSYVGVLPYKSGGSSLTTGADCSGFVCAIFAKYGYNLWGYRTKLKSLPASIAQNVGTNINNALPGDIIVYSGHVGIYAGNKLLINAANSTQGTVKKNYSYYGTVVAIMRVNGVVQSLSSPADTTPPTIHSIYVTDVSKDGYTVVCQATDESGIDRVQFPTYTDANGRDDMVSDWSTSTRIRGTYIGNNTYSFRVNVSEHNYEGGMYVTEIFAYDKFGNQKGLAENEYIRQNVDTTQLSSLGNKVDLGYSFNAYIKTEYGTYLTADSNNDVRARSSNGQLSQKWTFTRTSDGYYLIRNKMNGYGLDADGGFDISATNIMVHNPHLGANQKWGAYDAGNGSYYLSPESSKITVMDSPSFDQDGGNIYLYQFHEGQNQKFIIQKYDRYAVTLNSTTGGTVSGAGTYNNGTTVTLNATPESGYEFVGWYSGTTKVSASQNYSFTINNNVIYTAKFKIIENAPSTPSMPSEPSVPSTPIKPVTPTNNADTQIRSFVSRMYTVALGRDAEKAGLDDWSKQLINHTNDGAGLARGFICSAEFTGKNMSNDAYVNTLYKTFFDREPDASGKANWMNALNNGTSRNEVLAGFVNSAEFTYLCDKYGIARGTLENNGSSIYNAGVRDFVLRMYTKALNRDGETVGVEDWTNRINTKVMSPEAVAKSFFSSQEFINRNLNNADYVETLYQTFMDRASDPTGKADWVNKLNAGMSRQTVLEGFSRSEEFSKIMKSYGI